MSIRSIVFAAVSLTLLFASLQIAAQSLHDCADKRGDVFDLGNLDDFAPIKLAQTLHLPTKIETDADLKELHDIQGKLTPEQVNAAIEDSNQLSMEIYAAIFSGQGSTYDKETFPMTWNLSLHLCQEASFISSALKNVYGRKRPYVRDWKIVPLTGCESDPSVIGSSYPSGHSISGYLEALALAEIVSEKRNKILARADDFAHNREVCGVHYPSDVAAGHEVAVQLFNTWLPQSPRFKVELELARQEIQSAHVGK
jgi:acid phosphatase (class A)